MLAGWQAAVLALALSIVAFGPCRAAEDEIVARSPILGLIIEYLVQNPDAPLTEVAAYANARLDEHGLIYEFYRNDYLPGGLQPLDAMDRRLWVEMSDEDYVGPCGERLVHLSAIHADDERIDIIHKGEKIAVKRPEGLHLDTITVYSADRKSIVATLHVPRQDLPSNVSPDGRTVFIGYPLYERDLAWWARMRERHPQILHGYPYLVLAIGPDSVRFVDDPDYFAHGPHEDVTNLPGAEKRAGLWRWRFIESGFVVEFQPPCT